MPAFIYKSFEHIIKNFQTGNGDDALVGAGRRRLDEDRRAAVLSDVADALAAAADDRARQLVGDRHLYFVIRFS